MEAICQKHALGGLHHALLLRGALDILCQQHLHQREYGLKKILRVLSGAWSALPHVI